MPAKDYSLVGESARLAAEKGLAGADWYLPPVSKDTMRELLVRRYWPAVRDTSDAAWARSLEALKSAHQDLRYAISLLDDSRLKDIVPGKRYSVYFMLHGVIQHDLYHAGQIALLKKVV